MKKRIVSLVLAMLMCLSLSVTAFATEEACITIVSEVENREDGILDIEVDEDNYFEIVTPKERINADGTFEGVFDRYLESQNTFTPRGNQVSVTITSELCTSNSELYPSSGDPILEYKTYTMQILNKRGTTVIASKSFRLNTTTTAVITGLTAGTKYMFSLSPDDVLIDTAYTIEVSGKLNNVIVN